MEEPGHILTVWGLTSLANILVDELLSGPCLPWWWGRAAGLLLSWWPRGKLSLLKSDRLDL